jgi:glycosyltransferase involved in cell wall biosynthesis
MKSFILIPSFNDQLYLQKIINDLGELDNSWFIFVVDDGSDPPICIDIEKAILFRIPFNAGLGVVTNIALHVAKLNDFDFFVRIDADGQHPIQNVKKIIEKLMTEKCDLCIGERANHESYANFQLCIASFTKRHLAFISNLMSGMKIKDWNTGFFALNRFAIEKLSHKYYARYPEIDLYLNASNLKLAISTVKIEQHKRSDGKSTLTTTHSIRMVIRFYLILANHILGRVFK